MVLVLTVADRRHVDEREVWSWPIARLLRWGHYYARGDQAMERAMAGLKRTGG